MKICSTLLRERVCRWIGVDDLLLYFVFALLLFPLDDLILIAHSLSFLPLLLDIPGFYEVSAFQGTNVDETFFDAYRMWKAQAALKKEAAKQKKVKPPSGIGALMPWKWGRKAEYEVYHMPVLCARASVFAYNYYYSRLTYSY